MQATNIGWTDYSVNLLKYRNAKGKTVWGCVHASEGCRFCYAEALAKRWGRGEAFTAEKMKALTPYFDTEEARKFSRSMKVLGKKVFVDDMTDLFGEWVPDEIIDQHFALFAEQPEITFQVLTKRAERMRDYMLNLTERISGDERFNGDAAWPLRNVHLGVSAEDQKTADERVSLLVETPAAVRWASIEPLLDSVSLRWAKWEPFKKVGTTNQHDGARRLDGIVIGGESGPGHRQMPLESAIALARDNHEAGLAIYVKQDSGPRPGMQGRIPDDIWAMKEWPKAA